MINLAILKSQWKYSVLAALLYSLAIIYFIRADNFQASWVLYIGNMLFGLGILAHIFMYKPGNSPASTSSRKILAGHIVAVAGILISCVFILIIFYFLMPVVFHTNNAFENGFSERPAQMENGHQGIVFMVFMNNIIGNISAGSFISIVFSAVLSDKKAVENS